MDQKLENRRASLLVFVCKCNDSVLSPSWINWCQPCDGTYEAEVSRLSAGEVSHATVLPPNAIILMCVLQCCTVFVFLSLCPLLSLETAKITCQINNLKFGIYVKFSTNASVQASLCI